MDDATKEALVGRFREYLDTIEIPQDSGGGDQFSLFTELAGLRNEVRLESRQVKTALDEFRNVFTLLDRADKSLAEHLEHIREQERRVQDEALQPVLSGLVDLHDRLREAMRAERTGKPSFFAGLCRGREERRVKARLDGLRMLVNRMEGALAHFRVRPFSSKGRPFDARCMRAMGSEHHPNLDDAQVVEELRLGFRRDGDLFRPAEVIVNRID